MGDNMVYLHSILFCFLILTAESLTSSQSQTPSAEGPEPYQVIHVHFEEGVGDPVESRRNFEEGKSEQKRIAELAEREMRSVSKLDAIIATQKAEAMHLH